MSFVFLFLPRSGHPRGWQKRRDSPNSAVKKTLRSRTVFPHDGSHHDPVARAGQRPRVGRGREGGRCPQPILPGVLIRLLVETQPVVCTIRGRMRHARPREGKAPPPPQTGRAPGLPAQPALLRGRKCLQAHVGAARPLPRVPLRLSAPIQAPRPPGPWPPLGMGDPAAASPRPGQHGRLPGTAQPGMRLLKRVGGPGGGAVSLVTPR